MVDEARLCDEWYSEFEVRSGLNLVALLKSYNIQLSIHKDNEKKFKKKLFIYQYKVTSHGRHIEIR